MPKTACCIIGFAKIAVSAKSNWANTTRHLAAILSENICEDLTKTWYVDYQPIKCFEVLMSDGLFP